MTRGERAARIANAYAEAYLASTHDQRFEANSYAKAFLEDQIKLLKNRLGYFERALLDFAEMEKTVDNDFQERSSIAENSLAAANATLGQVVSERIKNEELWRQVENAIAINFPQLLSNGAIGTLQAKRKDLAAQYQSKIGNFKPGYPEMVDISNAIKELDRQLAVEVKNVKSTLKAAYELSLALEDAMKARVQALREEILDFQGYSIQNILKREVDTNRGLYNNLLQRYKEVEIAGGVGTSNVFVVEKAGQPLSPSWPRVGRNLLISLVLGFGAGVGLAILLEMLDDRVRAPEEIEQLTGLPKR